VSECRAFFWIICHFARSFACIQFTIGALFRGPFKLLTPFFFIAFSASLIHELENRQSRNMTVIDNFILLILLIWIVTNIMTYGAICTISLALCHVKNTMVLLCLKILIVVHIISTGSKRDRINAHACRSHGGQAKFLESRVRRHGRIEKPIHGLSAHDRSYYSETVRERRLNVLWR
jgi:hypothetical protein